MSRAPLLAPFALAFAALGPIAVLAGTPLTLTTLGQVLVAALGVFALWGGLASASR